jgi:hypothetical protein
LWRIEVVALNAHGRHFADDRVRSVAHTDDVVAEIHHRIAEEIPEDVTNDPGPVRHVPRSLINRLLPLIAKLPHRIELFPQWLPDPFTDLDSLDHFVLTLSEVGVGTAQSDLTYSGSDDRGQIRQKLQCPSCGGAGTRLDAGS